MSPLLVAAIALGASMGLAWIATLVRFHAAGKAFPELHSGSHPEPPADLPRVSLVVAGKDEEAEIEACARSLLTQDYPDLELVLVNDRSQDRTGEILTRLEAELGDRLRALTIDELPAGWGGQCHGLHKGVQASSGEWICFTDADCRFDSPRTVTIAVAEALAHGVELLSILPRMETPTAWEKLYIPVCSIVLLINLQIVETNQPDHPAGYANGAFLLIRRAAYERLGGHERVRGFVNDDVCLARLAKREGVPLRVAANLDLCRTRMYPSLGSAWRGWTRNLYGTLQTAPRLLGALIFTVGLFVLPWAGLTLTGVAAALDPAWRPAAAAWAVPVVVSHLGLWRLVAACGIPPAWSLGYVPGAIFVSALLARALGRATLRAGTTWHGVHYEHPPRVKV